MSMLPTVVVVVLPAASVQSAVTDWLAPALVTVTLNGFVPVEVVVAPLVKVSVETPESASLHVNVMVTSLFVAVPGVYGAVPPPDGIVAVVTSVGGAVSIFTVSDCGEDVLPATSEPKNETVVTPCAEITNEAAEPGTVIWLIVWAPDAL